MYRTCYAAFPNDPKSALCHWKIAWSQYLADPARAAAMLREHLNRYPDSDHTCTAIYFLGRIAEANRDGGAARVYYERLTGFYPNYYYAMLARGRLAGVAGASRSAEVTKYLSALQLPKATPPEMFVATPLTKERIERARLLAGAGLDDFAEGELRFGAKTDGQPQLMAAGAGGAGESPRRARSGDPLHQALRARIFVDVDGSRRRTNSGGWHSRCRTGIRLRRMRARNRWIRIWLPH